MNSQITLSVRGLLVSLVALLALVTAYLLGSSGGAPASSASAAEPAAASATHPGRIQMVGVGKTTVVPDQLSFTLSVTDKRYDLDDALAGSSATLKRVLGALADYGVRPQDVQTTGLQMYPEYDYHSSGPPTLTGYRVTQRAVVKVNDLTQGGRAIARAIDTGGNGVRARDIKLSVADPEAAIAKARSAAIDAATAKAQEYADATGEELGRVLTVRELSSPSRAVRPQTYNLARGALDMAAVKGAIPIRAGKDDLSVRVQVVWLFSE